MVVSEYDVDVDVENRGWRLMQNVNGRVVWLTCFVVWYQYVCRAKKKNNDPLSDGRLVVCFSGRR
jgi:hypothetical protein